MNGRTRLGVPGYGRIFESMKELPKEAGEEIEKKG